MTLCIDLIVFLRDKMANGNSRTRLFDLSEFLETSFFLIDTNELPIVILHSIDFLY